MEFLVFLLVVIIGILLYIAIKYQNANKKMHDTLELYVKNNKVVTDFDRYQEERTKEADRFCARKQSEVDYLNGQKLALQTELAELRSDLIVETGFVDEYRDVKSVDIKNQLSVLRNKQKDMVKNGKALIITSSEKKSVINKQAQQILRCFNTETTEIIGGVTVKNIDSSRTKINKSFETINNLFAVDGVQITREYLMTKLDEMSLVYSYLRRVEEEKEIHRANVEQMKEEEKARRELERREQEIEKDIKQHQNEVNKLMKYMQKSRDDVERQLYIDKIQELESKLKDLQESKADVSNRRQNAKAGFVYIISNVGSFGENVYKIGMTRRLEPMDRIRELSSASVPFVFDVHALIFSNDAPGLESTLHQFFDSKRINKVNPRKEFFKVDLEEIKQVVLENHNATVNFVDIPDATEYRETLKMEGKALPVQVEAFESTISHEVKSDSQFRPVPKKKVAKAQPVKVKPVKRDTTHLYVN